MRIVAGDIGGTKTLLQLVEVSGGAAESVRDTRYESSTFAAFGDMLADFVSKETRKIDAACFAVAGPVIGERAEGTNLSWAVDAPAIARDFAIPRVSLVNDFQAVALGVPLLGPGDLQSLNAGRRVEHAPIAILGAGTGLGEANLVYGGAKWNVIPSEGGHADFGPQDEEQAALFEALYTRYGHVSWERVLSGMGLVNIHNFLTGVDRQYSEQIPIEIAALAEEGDETAKHTFEIFVDLYGAEAGNMALRVLARGGVFLAGGIAAKNIRWFTEESRFVKAFTRKGRFRTLVEEIPVDLILNPNVGLLGAREVALRLAAEGASR